MATIHALVPASALAVTTPATSWHEAADDLNHVHGDLVRYAARGAGS